jgi:hypothetical protein
MARADLLATLASLNDFGLCAPDSKATIELEGAWRSEPTDDSIAAALLSEVGQRAISPFQVRTAEAVTPSSSRQGLPNTAGDPTRVRTVRLSFAAPEWSFRSAGWLAALVTDIFLRVGVRSPLTLTISCPTFGTAS